MHVPSSPIVQGCVVGGGGGGGGGKVVGVGAGAGAGAGAADGAGAGAGAAAFDADDADVPLFPPPLLPTGACAEATPPATGEVGVADRPGGAWDTDARGSAFTRGPRVESLVSPPASAPSAARTTPLPPGRRETSLATSP
jgi:hypothetical protein